MVSRLVDITEHIKPGFQQCKYLIYLVLVLGLISIGPLPSRIGKFSFVRIVVWFG
jgi:hypothetical protein